MYLEKYENETYVVCKASKHVYFSDNRESIMILEPPSWISKFKLFRNVRKSANLI